MRHDGGFFSILCLSALENMLVGGPVNSHCGQQQPPGIVDCGSWPWKPLGGWGRCEECEGDEPRRAEREQAPLQPALLALNPATGPQGSELSWGEMVQHKRSSQKKS